MEIALVGYTGFVGSNLEMSIKNCKKFNTKNIELSFGTKPDLLIYSAVPAAMFIANSRPKEDFEVICNAIENIKKIDAKRVVLISTVAVYENTQFVDETHIINEKLLLPYGKNRLYLERWVSLNCENSLVVRLPAVYGYNLKKNFIYDLINIIPKMLKIEKFEELVKENESLSNFYKLEEDNFYHCTDEKSRELYLFFKNNKFNALSFTDSRSIYQFYNLSNLWRDISIALDNNLKLLNISTEPVSIKEVYSYIIGGEFINELNIVPYNYNIKTIYSDLFYGSNGYITSKQTVLEDLKEYVKKEIIKQWE